MSATLPRLAYTSYLYTCSLPDEASPYITTAFIMPGSESHDEGHKAKLFGQQGGLLEAAQRFWQKSYAGDYLGLAVLFAAYSVIQLSTEPFHQMFTLSDTRIQHPHAEVERVPVCK